MIHYGVRHGLKPSDMGFRKAAPMTGWEHVGLVRQLLEYVKPSTCSHPDTSTAPCGDARFASTNSAASIHSPVPLITEHTFSRGFVCICRWESLRFRDARPASRM